MNWLHLKAFPQKDLVCLWGLWGLIGQLRFNFLFFQPEKKKEGGDVLISRSLPAKDSHFVFHFPNSISFKMQDVCTAKSSTSDNSWELIVLIKIVNTLFLRGSLLLRNCNCFFPDYFFTSAGLMDPVYKKRSCDQQNSCLQLLLCHPSILFLCVPYYLNSEINKQ